MPPGAFATTRDSRKPCVEDPTERNFRVPTSEKAAFAGRHATCNGVQAKGTGRTRTATIDR